MTFLKGIKDTIGMIVITTINFTFEFAYIVALVIIPILGILLAIDVELLRWTYIWRSILFASSTIFLLRAAKTLVLE